MTRFYDNLPTMIKRSRKSRSSKNNRRLKTLSMESLENRVLLAAGLTARQELLNCIDKNGIGACVTQVGCYGLPGVADVPDNIKDAGVNVCIWDPEPIHTDAGGNCATYAACAV